jgi:hypothetical protein
MSDQGGRETDRDVRHMVNDLRGVNVLQASALWRVYRHRRLHLSTAENNLRRERESDRELHL